MASCAPANIGRQMQATYKCQAQWQYFNLDKDLTASVIAYNKGFCHLGNSKVATSAIVITSEGDTIRVLEFCAKSKFNRGDKVSVTKSTTPAINDRAALNLEFDCKVMKTCYAHLDKIKEQ